MSVAVGFELGMHGRCPGETEAVSSAGRCPFLHPSDNRALSFYQVQRAVVTALREEAEAQEHAGATHVEDPLCYDTPYAPGSAFDEEDAFAAASASAAGGFNGRLARVVAGAYYEAFQHASAEEADAAAAAAAAAASEEDISCYSEHGGGIDTWTDARKSDDAAAHQGIGSADKGAHVDPDTANGTQELAGPTTRDLARRE